MLKLANFVKFESVNFGGAFVFVIDSLPIVVHAGINNLSKKLAINIVLFLRRKGLLPCTIIFLLNYRNVDRKENSV